MFIRLSAPVCHVLLRFSKNRHETTHGLRFRMDFIWERSWRSSHDLAMNIIPIASRSFERIRWSAFFLWNVCLYWPVWTISSFLGRIPVDYNEVQQIEYWRILSSVGLWFSSLLTRVWSLIRCDSLFTKAWLLTINKVFLSASNRDFNEKISFLSLK